MTVLERTHTTINLHADCLDDDCAAFASKLHTQLSSGRYTWPCSVLLLPESVEAWRDEHRTARKRAARARRLGYHGGTWERAGFESDIYDINTSSAERQGRPMSDSYRVRPSFHDSPYPCPLHGVHYYGVRMSKGGVHGAGRLVAYLWVYRAGELALVSSILGHADHLANDVMYPLFEAALSGEIAQGGTMVYNRHDSGTDGLRFFKERLGFRPAHVEWSK